MYYGRSTNDRFQAQMAFDRLLAQTSSGQVGVVWVIGMELPSSDINPASFVEVLALAIGSRIVLLPYQ
jgi:hypothetical protein